MGDLRVFDTNAEFDRAAAEFFVAAAGNAIRARGRFTVALSGGSTPRSMYALLADATGAGYHDRVAWDQVQIFWGDERHVPPDDPQSNYRMAREAFLDHVPIPQSNVHRVRAENPDAAAAAADYESELQREFSLAPGQFPAFDLVLLGLGPDAHTASLFPGVEAIHERERLVVAPWIEKFQSHRITLTPPAINAARQVAFLTRGEDKAEPLREVLRGQHDPDHYPAQIVQPASGRLTWIVDRAAARLVV